LKTFRLPRSLESVLELEAKSRGLSPNALASMIFTKFALWDRYAARFGYVNIARESLRSILELADEDKLAAVARRVGAEASKEAVLFWFKRANVETYLSYLENVCKYGGHGEYECQASGGDFTITVRHALGMRWSKWLSCSLDEALRKMLGIVGQFELSDSEVICRFSTPALGAGRQLAHGD
jgi:hypothetical protein